MISLTSFIIFIMIFLSSIDFSFEFNMLHTFYNYSSSSCSITFYCCSFLHITSVFGRNHSHGNPEPEELRVQPPLQPPPRDGAQSTVRGHQQPGCGQVRTRPLKLFMCYLIMPLLFLLNLSLRDCFFLNKAVNGNH